jgi:hypothetical protein
MALLSDIVTGLRFGGLLPITDITTTYTVVSADSGKCLRSTSVADVTWTLSKTAPRGTALRGIQGTGAITFAEEAGAPPVDNLLGYEKTGGENAEFSLTVMNNTDGSSAEWVVSGPMTS